MNVQIYRLGAKDLCPCRHSVVDDTVLLAASARRLQRLLDVVNVTSKEYGLDINSKKTKCMVVSEVSPEPRCHLSCNSTTIEQVSQFNYLGALITADG